MNVAKAFARLPLRPSRNLTYKPTACALSSSGVRALSNDINSKPPIPLYGIDGTYASALYTAAVKTSCLDATAKSIVQIQRILQQDHALQKILQAPTLTAKDKAYIVSELVNCIGSNGKGDATPQFLQTLAENNRLAVLPEACESFSKLMGASRGELEMTVTSAQKLDTKSLQKLEAAVAKSDVSRGRKLKVITKVNPELKGGLIVAVGDRTVDLSVSSKIAKMNKLLQDSI